MSEREPRLLNIVIQPGLPEHVVRDTFEGNLLWGMLRFRLEPSEVDGLVPLCGDNVKEDGSFFYCVAGGTIEPWVEAAEGASSELAVKALPILRQGEDRHRGRFEFGAWVDQDGERIVTIPKLLQALLASHGDKLDNDRFVVRASASDLGGEFAGSAAFVTAAEIAEMDLEKWLSVKTRMHDTDKQMQAESGRRAVTVRPLV
jgi:hypothetical protein